MSVKYRTDNYEILYSGKQQQQNTVFATYNNIDPSYRYNVEWKKADRKEYMPYDFIFMKLNKYIKTNPWW